MSIGRDAHHAQERVVKFRDQPVEVTFIRHAESTGNLAKHLEYKNMLSAATSAELRELLRVDWDIPLSSTGREQARLLGESLKSDPDFSLESIARVFVSNYRRTRETAHYVLSAAGFDPQHKIELNPTVGERDWGDHYLIDEIEKQRHYQLRKEDPFCWSPEAGESMRHTRERVNHLFATLNRRFGGERVLVFTHGEFIISAMAEIQRVYDQEQFGELLVKGMPNCGVVQFSRLSPEGEESQYYSHIKRFAAGELQGKHADWNVEKSPIVLPNYTLENLLLPPSPRSSRLFTLLEQETTNP